MGNNSYAYCGNNSVCYADDSGYSHKYVNPFIGGFAALGGNATGVSSCSAAGGGGGSPIPFVGLTFAETIKAINIISDVVDTAQGLSQAAKYGIKGYSKLKKN